MKSFDAQALVEQIALLLASFVWTTVVLSVIALYWVYQDVNARWEVIARGPSQAVAQAASSPDPTPNAITFVNDSAHEAGADLSPTPTATAWAGPPPTRTPSLSNQVPTPTPTQVVQPPSILPETLNADEPTPVPVIVHTDNEAAEFGVNNESSTETTITADVPTQMDSTEATPGDQPTRIIIDSVGIDSKVVPVGWQVVEQNDRQYSVWQVAEFAIGWHKTTAALGQRGNTVMAGHHNVHGEVFRDLVNVEVGDRVVAYSEGQKFEYIVELKTIVKEKGEPVELRQQNARWISTTDDERLTLVTCWPYTNNTHRVIVVAKPV